jgi:hypothetical protein
MMTDSIAQTKFPPGCRIINIMHGKGSRSHFVYATLVDADGKLLIRASLDYICAELLRTGVEDE